MIKKGEAIAQYADNIRAEVEKLEKVIDNAILTQYRGEGLDIAVLVDNYSEDAYRAMEKAYAESGHWNTKIIRDGNNAPWLILK